MLFTVTSHSHLLLHVHAFSVLLLEVTHVALDSLLKELGGHCPSFQILGSLTLFPSSSSYARGHVEFRAINPLI